MEVLSVSSPIREGVIVVVDAKRKKRNVDAVDWAFRHVIRPKDVVLVLGVLYDRGKKNYSCFPLKNMGISISGIWEKLEFSSGNGEVNPRQLGEEIERKRELYQNTLQPFYRQCKKNEVKLEVKLAAGYCPARLTIDEAQKSNTRWIVLDSHLEKHKWFINFHVGCNLAIMKGKNCATWMPSKTPQRRTSPQNCNRTNGGVSCFNNNDQLETFQVASHGNPDQEAQSSINRPAPAPEYPLWYPLSWQTDSPRPFTLSEIEEMTNAFAEENKREEIDNMEIYQGILQEKPVIVQSFLENDDRFWSMLMILLRVRHRNIANLVGYCYTGTSRLLLADYPFLCTVEINLSEDDYARELTWITRWYIALQIGGSLRYLHEECSEGSISHQSICSANIALSCGCTAMLSNFVTAKFFHEESPAELPNSEKDESLSLDVHDYGMLLVELITGKSARLFHKQGEGQSLVDWALPYLKDGSLNQVIDPRLMNNCTDEISRVVHYMANAALLCLHSVPRRPSISEVLAVVRGDQLAMSKC